MKFRASLLGFLATGSQVLLLRELVSSLNGSELFVGTAMFGWLIWVAIGAWIGGAMRKPLPTTLLFVCGALVLPAAIIATRLSPLVATELVGELIPFTTAILISILVVLPSGVIAGLLFPTIARAERTASEPIVRVYLWEGVGAFVAGVLATLLAGEIMSTLALASTLCVAVIAGALILSGKSRTLKAMGALLVILVAGILLEAVGPAIDRLVDQGKYKGYQVVLSGDTPYSHQVLLSRDSTFVLLTNGNVEAQYPDLGTTENLIIPPLVYLKDARSVLFVGRQEFGVVQLARRFPNMTLASLDPRRGLDIVLDSTLHLSNELKRISDDPARYFSSVQIDQRYDIIVIGPSELSDYRSSREVSTAFLIQLKRHLKPNGILLMPTSFDTDRYITSEASLPLAAIHSVLGDCFRHVISWPGTRTLFLASDTPGIELPYDSIVARILSLPYQPQYVNNDYLRDRLSSFKQERLTQTLARVNVSNSFERPLLPYYQALYRAKANSLDHALLSPIVGGPIWLIGLVILLALGIVTLARTRRSNSVPLLFYFTAGVASLTLELIAFYVLQVTAGALYSEMAALIGAFMLGLAVGTFVTYRSARAGAEYIALIMLIVATAMFAATCRTIPSGLALIYHVLFLFVVAVATGTLFTAATMRYYRKQEGQNPGIGYTWELIGSSLGALLPTTVLLPVFGFGWLMTSVILLCALTLAAGLIADRIH